MRGDHWLREKILSHFLLSQEKVNFVKEFPPPPKVMTQEGLQGSFELLTSSVCLQKKSCAAPQVQAGEGSFFFFFFKVQAPKHMLQSIAYLMSQQK